MRKITALMPSSATESPCRRKAAATTAWPKPHIATLRREQTRPFRHPQLFGNVVSCFSICDSCDFHVGSHNKTSQGHVVIVCLIFNRVQAAGAVDLGALQSTHHGKLKTIRKYFVCRFENDIEDDWRTTRTLIWAAHQTTTDLQEFQAAIEDVQLPPKLPDLHIPTQFLPHFICFHFYVGTWRISKGFAWSRATLRSRKAFYLLTANHRKIWTWHHVMQKWKPKRSRTSTRYKRYKYHNGASWRSKQRIRPRFQNRWSCCKGCEWRCSSWLCQTILQIQSRSIIIPNRVCH